MADKHKQAHEVTLVPHAEASGFELFVRTYWKLGLGAFLAIAAAILVLQSQRHSSALAERETWASLDETLGFNVFGGMTNPVSAADLEDVAGSLSDVDAGAWARLNQAVRAISEREYDQALAALDALERDHAGHAIVTQARSFVPGAAELTAPEFLRQRAEQLQAWEEARPELFENPALPDDSPRVRISTSEGDIVLRVALDRAPLHAANFLKLCSEGYYDGILFHRILAGRMIQAGDPNSRDNEDKTTWGIGGPDYTIEPEISDLRHFPGALSAAKKTGALESSGSQFFICVGAVHGWDEQYTVFGVVEEGLEIAEEIASAEIEEGQSDRPADPVEILSTTVTGYVVPLAPAVEPDDAGDDSADAGLGGLEDVAGGAAAYALQRAEALAEIAAIQTALELYAVQNAGNYPAALEELIVADENGAAFLEGAEVPVDPWGNAYRYVAPADGAADFMLFSLGADGAEGGEGEDADIHYGDE